MFLVELGNPYENDTYDFTFDTFNECSDFIKICLLNKHVVTIMLKNEGKEE